MMSSVITTGEKSAGRQKSILMDIYLGIFDLFSNLRIDIRHESARRVYFCVIFDI